MQNEVELISKVRHGSLTDIYWKSEASTETSILFYRLSDDPRAEEVFRKRIKDARYGTLVLNRPSNPLPKNSLVCEEARWPELQKEILDLLYPMPPLKFIAVTGTNGKTTTTDLVLQLGTMAGKKGISIGTLGVRENKRTLLDFGMTSPSYIDLRKFLHQYGHGKDFCVMEASSHALAQARLYRISFSAAGWLSFSQDHLDYHQTMDEYFRAKCLILQQLATGAKLFVPQEQECLYERLCDISTEIKRAPVIDAELPLFFRPRFNRNNLEVAKALVESAFDLKLTADYENLESPDGRFYIRSYRSNLIVVDFAHTPDALANICRGVREAFPKHRLKVLFGCGGDRDRSKRPKMAEVVSRWAEQVYVTSDNPRTEDPERIIEDILEGIGEASYQVIVTRPEAVRTAFRELKENELLLLAGKGHEDYILMNGVKHPYSDIQEVEEFLSRNGYDQLS